MKDSVSTYCHFGASGGGSVNGNKHNNRASPCPPKYAQKYSTIPSPIPGFHWKHKRQHHGCMTSPWHGGGKGKSPCNDTGIWGFHRVLFAMDMAPGIDRSSLLE